MRRMHWRSLVGLMVALPVVAVVLGIFACLPVPVGDPEKSKVDEKLVGGWLLRTDEARRELYVVRAFDARTYLVQFFEYEEKDGAVEGKSSGTFKAWLTELGGARFMTLQPLPIEEPLGMTEKDAKRIWVVLKLGAKGADMTARIVKPDAAPLKDIKTREDAEKALTANVANDEIYGDTAVFRRMTEKDEELIPKLQDAFKAKWH